MSRVAILVGVGVGREAGVGADQELLPALLADGVVDGADDGHAMGVVTGDDDQRVGVLGLEFAGQRNGLVEFDGVEHGAFHVERMAGLVDAGRLDHQEEALGILREVVEGDLGHLDKTRLVGELVDGTLLELHAIEGVVHVAGVEQAEDLVRTGRLLKLGLVGGELVAGVLEQLDVVLVVLALGTRHFLRQEIG